MSGRYRGGERDDGRYGGGREDRDRSYGRGGDRGRHQSDRYGGSSHYGSRNDRNDRRGDRDGGDRSRSDRPAYGSSSSRYGGNDDAPRRSDSNNSSSHYGDGAAEQPTATGASADDAVPVASSAWDPKKEAENDPTWARIYVSNLPTDVTSDELQEMFGAIGLVAREKQKRGYKDQWPYKIKVYTDESGQVKGDAVITYEDANAARTAPEFFNGQEIRGKTIKVELAGKPEPPAGGWQGGGGRGGGRGGGGRYGGGDRYGGGGSRYGGDRDFRDRPDRRHPDGGTERDHARGRERRAALVRARARGERARAAAAGGSARRAALQAVAGGAGGPVAGAPRVLRVRAAVEQARASDAALRVLRVPGRGAAGRAQLPAARDLLAGPHVLRALPIAALGRHFGYMLQLNRSRGRLADDRLLRDVLCETNAAYSADHDDVKLALWRTKWAQLVQQFKKKHTDPTFEAIVRLYAHRDGAVDRLAKAYDRNPTVFEFYLPQLCSFLLYGAFVQSPQLGRILLEKCSLSHVFAHKMLWYLQSYCLYTKDTDQHVHLLLDDVAHRGAIPARAIDTQENGDNDDAKSKDRHTLLSCAPAEVEALLSQRSAHDKDEQYFTFQGQTDLERGISDPFENETTFLTALANLSSNLRAVAYHQRNDMERVPYLLCAEVVGYPSPLEQKQAMRKRSSMFNGRRFTLSLWDNNTSNSAPSDLLKAAQQQMQQQAPKSPDAAKLGFWSESKPSPRKRSFSQHISSSIPQPGELFTGLIDTLVQKMPGAKHNHNQSQANLTASDPLKGTPHEALLGASTHSDDAALKRPLSPSSLFHNAPTRKTQSFLPERSQSQPFATAFNSSTSALNDAGKFSLTIDTSAPSTHSGTGATGGNGGGYGRRVVPDPLQSPQASRYEPEDDLGLWSPKSDTVLSPQSLGSPSSPHPLARYDSTDRYLETLSQRDNKYVDEEAEGEEGDSSGAPLSGRRSDQPLVIFTERWADKERRIQATSEFGDAPGWRLLPVIVKSNDDLRQEQLAAQLIQQFAKVFDEANVPVFLRPYDVIAISSTSGLVEAIADTISIDSLKRNDRAFTTLLDFFVRHFGDPSSSEFRKARSNFVRSMAGYAIVCYLLQVKDRHNGNILLDAEGHIIHIDFGFILSNNPGNMAFEQAPFKLTNDFVELMGGPRSASFRHFRSLCVRAFLVARKYRHRFILLVEMMLNGNEHLPCFAGDPKGTVERLAARFQPELDINSCEDFVHSLIDASLDNWRTKWYDKYQRWLSWLVEKTLMDRRRRKKPTPKLHPGWNPIGKTQRRQRLAATMIQKCFRSYLLRAAFRANRVNVAQSFDALRAFHHVRDRKYWRTVDLRALHREELRMLALALNLPSTGKKVLLMDRIQRWVDQRLRVHDVAGDAAAKALANRAKCQGSVYFCEAYPGTEPIDIRPLRGKSITRVAACVCRNAPIGDKDKDDPLAFADPIESRWLVNPVFMQPLRSEHMADVRVARSHVVALTAAGELFSWGENPHGELGFAVESAAAVARNRAEVVTGLATYPAVSVAVGRHHTIAVCDDVTGHNGVTFAWDSNAYRQLGTSGMSNANSNSSNKEASRNGGSMGFPRPCVLHRIEALRAVNVRKVAYSMALSNDGHVYSWGCNDGGRLGHGHEAGEGKNGSATHTQPMRVRGTLETLVAACYEKEQDGGHVQRLWRGHPTVIPPLDMRKLPLSSSSFAKPPLRLEPAADRALREKEERAEAARIDTIDVDALVHPLCRVCWRCDGFHPSPLKLWVCRQCCHDKQLHGVRGKNNPMGEYEAVRKLQTLYRARKAKRMLQQARERHYERVFSIKHNAFFYYNLWRDTASWSWPEHVGVDVELPIRDPDALPVIKPPLTRYEAAVVIQARRRGALVRRSARTRLLQLYEKHIDAESDEVYYVHKTWTPALKQERKRLTTTPALLKRLYDLGEPVEIQRLRKCVNWTPDDAARVLQAHFRAHQAHNRMRKQLRMRYKKLLDGATGQFFYYNTVTKVSTWEPPIWVRESALDTPNEMGTKKDTLSKQGATTAKVPKHGGKRHNIAAIHGENAAATMIQALFRGHMALSGARELAVPKDPRRRHGVRVLLRRGVEAGVVAQAAAAGRRPGLGDHGRSQNYEQSRESAQTVNVAAEERCGHC
ncbi:Phosphatidylinositol kinase, partial [Globisporangium splendens]